jgi:hypothetical protein
MGRLGYLRTRQDIDIFFYLPINYLLGSANYYDLKFFCELVEQRRDVCRKSAIVWHRGKAWRLGSDIRHGGANTTQKLRATLLLGQYLLPRASHLADVGCVIWKAARGAQKQRNVGRKLPRDGPKTSGWTWFDGAGIATCRVSARCFDATNACRKTTASNRPVAENAGHWASTEAPAWVAIAGRGRGLAGCGFPGSRGA